MKYLICNLKMNHTLQDMLNYRKTLETFSFPFRFLLAPATCYLPLMHAKSYDLVAQNVSLFENEHNTASISTKTLASLDVKGVLIGHAELKETLMDKKQKMFQVVKNNMKAFVLLSNTLEEFYYQYTSMILTNQIETLLEDLESQYWPSIYFVYEPEWLIGQEVSLKVDEVVKIFQEVHDQLNQKYHYHFPLLYGGGLSEREILTFLNQEEIAGVLIGKFGYDVTNLEKLTQKM